MLQKCITAPDLRRTDQLAAIGDDLAAGGRCKARNLTGGTGGTGGRSRGEEGVNAKRTQGRSNPSVNLAVGIAQRPKL